MLYSIFRQEAYEIANMRAKKVEEYKRQKLLQDIKDKDDRCAAIKRGFGVLEHMRNTMKDIMNRTNMELKHEFDHLKHTGEISPDKVVQKALAVSKQVLFPK